MSDISRRGRHSTLFPLVKRRPLSAQWPEADRQAWAMAIGPAASPLDDPGSAAHLSVSSQRLREKTYGSFLCWLEAEGQLDITETPAMRVRPDRVAGWFAETRGRVAARTADMALVHLSLVIEAMVPGNDWRWVRKTPGRPSRADVRAIADGKPKPPDTIQIAADAIDLCIALDDTVPSIGIALEYRDALIIALACYHAPRLSNLAEIQMGEHLISISDSAWRLRIRRTKNSEPLTPRLGAGLVPCLERYLQIYRPLLLDGREDHGFLWVNQRSLPLAPSAFRRVFQNMGRRLAGVGLSPHGVRHGMATGLMQMGAGGIRIAAAALGHRGTASVNQVYDRSDISVFATEWKRILKKRQGL
ncbi:tyrosine-type recombinase/integrase [Belnapia sp. T18]|uniref:Tyrosine-type recombinase/integrase n=1 Tax=Belnapia arida TaxID=2804533 RepID=A0ABS1U9G9_9PROT|nr:tyrosine-type recombinase/integrase [Belnapia arida]MBL6081331.1 tyrosine-type recombinase/integrase [Belnapia arida]